MAMAVTVMAAVTVMTVMAVMAMAAVTVMTVLAATTVMKSRADGGPRPRARNRELSRPESDSAFG